MTPSPIPRGAFVRRQSEPPLARAGRWESELPAATKTHSKDSKLQVLGPAPIRLPDHGFESFSEIASFFIFFFSPSSSRSVSVCSHLRIRLGVPDLQAACSLSLAPKVVNARPRHSPITRLEGIVVRRGRTPGGEGILIVFHPAGSCGSNNQRCAKRPAPIGLTRCFFLSSFLLSALSLIQLLSVPVSAEGMGCPMQRTCIRGGAFLVECVPLIW